MSTYNVSKIFTDNKYTNDQVTKLLEAENIRRDKNLDYTCGIFNLENELIATGSCYGNSLRCLAVSSQHQGEGLMNTIVTHLVNYQFKKGNFHLFIYTKPNSASIFKDLGFYEIAKIENELVFLENKKNGFKNYLRELETSMDNHINKASIVMNANPFSLGHQHLIETAISENDCVHVFLVREDSSIFPYEVREELVREGTAHLKNVIIHSSGPYIISNATFPSYFQKDEDSIIRSQALLDITLFKEISKRLNITSRYVGEEPFSVVTGIYNKTMKDELSRVGIKFVDIKRKEINGKVISASTIREAIKNDDLVTVKKMVPKTTFDFLKSNEAKSIIQKIKSSRDVIHY